MESFNKSFNEPNDSSTQQNNRRASMGAAPFDANTSFSVGSTSNPTRETSRSSSIEASSDDGSSSTNPLMNASSGMGANGRYYNPVVMSFIRDDWIKQQLHLREAAYTRFQNTSVVTGTWNVNAKKPLTASEANKLVQWIQLQTTSMQPLRSPTVSPSNLPDIIALGFQEIVDLNAVNVVVNNMSAQRAAAWEESLLYALNTLMSNQQYRVVMSKHLVGIMLIVFVRVDHAPFVKEIYGATAGVGVLGMMGNKGGVAIRMTFYDSTICFVCAHLAAHKENCAGRNADYANILNKIEFGDTDNDSATSTGLIGLNSSNSSSSYTGSSRFGAYEETVPILNHDYVFWIGDLNYRIDDLTTEECFQCVEKGNLLFLAQHDQLNKEKAKGNCFHGFQEGPLVFLPTYKFQAGTSLYEKRPEKKLRAPAWCDRILWKTKQNKNPSNVMIQQKTYGICMALEISDHKPVQASFQIQIKHTMEQQKNQIIKEILLQLDKWENENMPKVKLEIFEPTTITTTTTTTSMIHHHHNNNNNNNNDTTNVIMNSTSTTNTTNTTSSTNTNTLIFFSSLKFQVPQVKTLTIENIGVVVAHFRFIPKLQDTFICKKWLHISPLYGMIPPKEKFQIQLIAKINIQNAQEITAGMETLEDTIILRIENGRDFFLMVSGKYENSSFGLSLDQLILMEEPVRKYTPCLTIAKFEQLAIGDQKTQTRTTTTTTTTTTMTTTAASASGGGGRERGETSPLASPRSGSNKILSSSPQRVPKELWRMVNDLYQHFIKEKGLFIETGNQMELIELREALDMGIPFPKHSGFSMAELLLSWLQSLRGSVIPDEVLVGIENLPELPKDAAQAAQISMEDLRNTYRIGCRTLLDGLSPVRYNTFIYIVSFLKEILKHHPSNKLTPQKLAKVFSRCLLSPIPSTSIRHDMNSKSDTNSRTSNGGSSGNSSSSNCGGGGGGGTMMLSVSPQQATTTASTATSTCFIQMEEETTISHLNFSSAQRTQQFIVRAEKLERMLLFFFSTSTI